MNTLFGTNGKIEGGFAITANPTYNPSYPNSERFSLR
jgi:hypothetical protein